jgi:hypothetical protein
VSRVALSIHFHPPGVALRHAYGPLPLAFHIWHHFGIKTPVGWVGLEASDRLSATVSMAVRICPSFSNPIAQAPDCESFTPYCRDLPVGGAVANAKFEVAGNSCFWRVSRPGKGISLSAVLCARKSLFSYRASCVCRNKNANRIASRRALCRTRDTLSSLT